MSICRKTLLESAVAVDDDEEEEAAGRDEPSVVADGVLNKLDSKYGCNSGYSTDSSGGSSFSSFEIL